MPNICVVQQIHVLLPSIEQASDQLNIRTDVGYMNNLMWNVTVVWLGNTQKGNMNEIFQYLSQTLKGLEIPHEEQANYVTILL